MNCFTYILLLTLLFCSIPVVSQDIFYRPYIQGDTVTSNTASRLNGAIVSPTITIADSTINWVLGNEFSKTLTANQRFVFTNLREGQIINVTIGNNTSNYTVTWVNTVAWTNDITPVQTIGAKTDIYTFHRIGSITYGAVSQNY